MFLLSLFGLFVLDKINNSLWNRRIDKRLKEIHYEVPFWAKPDNGSNFLRPKNNLF